MNLIQFQHSAFLQSLGWAIAASLWQGGLLWIIYHIIVSFYSNASPKLKTNLSTICLFGTFVWFIITFISKLISLQNNISGDTQKILSSQFNYASSGIILHNFISSILISLPYLSFAYLILLLFFTIKLINSYRSLNFLKNNGLEKPSGEWRLFAEKVATQICINKKIKLWLSNHIDVPATIGFFKPVILIPIASLNQLTVNQLEAIILHEISHIKRNDYIINLFISLIDTILFFNPFIVLISKIIKRERENCCDDFVLQYQYDRHSYASALLCLEQSRNLNLRLALTATSGKKQLLSRIKRIMEIKKSTDHYNYGQRLLALFLVTVLIYSLVSFSPAKKRNESFNPLPEKNLIAATPQTNKITHIFLRSKDEENHFDLLQKNNLPKDKPVAQLHPNLKKREETFFSFSMNNENNNIAFANNNGVNQNKELIPPKDVKSFPASPIGGNSFYAPKFDLSDLKFLESFPDNINVEELKSDIEKSKQSLSELTWNTLKHEIKENLGKIKMPKIDIRLDKSQFPSDFEELTKLKVNTQQEFKKLLDIDMLLKDSLGKKKYAFFQ